MAELRAGVASVPKTRVANQPPPQRPPQLTARVKHQWKRAPSDKSGALTPALLLIEPSETQTSPALSLNHLSETKMSA